VSFFKTRDDNSTKASPTVYQILTEFYCSIFSLPELLLSNETNMHLFSGLRTMSEHEGTS
jgi:uncharacterized protein (DUF608 family)